MKVLKQGDLNSDALRKKFECKNCGCVFVANSGEYRMAGYIESVHNGIEASCECPCCKHTVYLHW